MMEDYGMLGALIAGSLLLGFICFVVLLVIYILGATWEMKFLRSLGYPNSWFAWIPILNFYALADVAFGNAPKAKLAVINKPVSTAVFKFASLISTGAFLVLGVIPIVRWFRWILLIIFNIAVLLPILNVLSRRYSASMSEVRKYVDIFIQLILFYDLKTWSEKYQYNPYVDISDIAGVFDSVQYPQQQQTMNGYQQQPPMNGYQQQQTMNGYQQQPPMNGYQQQQPMNGYQQQSPMNGYQSQPTQMGGYAEPQMTIHDSRFAPPTQAGNVQSFEETFTPPSDNTAQDFSNDIDNTTDLF